MGTWSIFFVLPWKEGRRRFEIRPKCLRRKRFIRALLDSHSGANTITCEVKFAFELLLELLVNLYKQIFQVWIHIYCILHVFKPLSKTLKAVHEESFAHLKWIVNVVNNTYFEVL